MKSNDEVIHEFNDLVNMTTSELEKWLKSSESNSAGWSKDSGDGESVGHDSGRKIVEILQDNPQKNPDKYSDDQIDHMRKVVAYCKRHLAQESAANAKKSTEELKKTKSYASLKNWGHDILKKQNGKADNAEAAEAGDKRSRQEGPTGDNKVRKTTKSSTAKDEKGEEEEDEEEDEEKDEEEVEDADDGDDVDGDDDGDDDEDEEKDDNDADEAGEGRQTRSKTNGKKAQKNGKGKKSNSNNDADADADDADADDDGDDDDEEDGDAGGGEEGQEGDQKDTSSSKSKNGEPAPGDTVSWNWGQGQPKGKVLDVKHEKTSIETERGNEVSRVGSDKDPAVLLDTGKSKAIKLDHELN